jgi:glycosyltransferase involved in cell wall biosynthesis
MSVRFSIIVCAYNASGRITEPLEHICRLDYPSEYFELIVVDNNSTDNTSEAVREVLKVPGISFEHRIIKEMTQGLIHARIAGVQAAKHDYLVFVDDDNLLEPEYLSHASMILQENQKIGALGGQVSLKTDLKELPAWFYSYANAYAVGAQAQFSGDVSTRGYLWGAGIILKKSLLKLPIDHAVPFALSGRSGSKLTSGDDSEICKWVLISGHTLYYSSDLKLVHVIPSTRIKKPYIDTLLKALDDSGAVLNVYDRWLWRQKCRQNAKKNLFRWIMSELRFAWSKNEQTELVVTTIKRLQAVFSELKS